MTELIVYFTALLVFFAISFKVLRAVNLENIFKKNHIWEIKAAYILFSLVIAHIIARIIMHFYEWATIIIQSF